MELPAPHYTGADWFSGHIPNWERWLEDLRGRPGLRTLEIGSFEGRSTRWMLQHVLTDPSSRIECIDLFLPDGLHGDYRQRFRANLAPWSQQVIERQGPSFEQLRIVEGPYDVVYVDGWHSAFGALADGVMAWPLLKTGGVMIFDDYRWLPQEFEAALPARPRKWSRMLLKLLGSGERAWRNRQRDRMIATVPTRTPKLGIDTLLQTLAGQYTLLGADYQVAIRKTADVRGGTFGIDT